MTYRAGRGVIALSIPREIALRRAASRASIAPASAGEGVAERGEPRLRPSCFVAKAAA